MIEEYRLWVFDEGNEVSGDFGMFFEVRTGGPFNHSVVVEDDGRVAYAYLLDDNGDIVADVWLYNRVATPDQPQWNSIENAPFLNSSDFADQDEAFLPLAHAHEVQIQWTELNDSGPRASVLLRGELFAVLTAGSKPGRCRLAKKNGPLAKVLEKVSGESGSRRTYP